jgi:hypothetical protein
MLFKVNLAWQYDGVMSVGGLTKNEGYRLGECLSLLNMSGIQIQYIMNQFLDFVNNSFDIYMSSGF